MFKLKNNFTQYFIILILMLYIINNNEVKGDNLAFEIIEKFFLDTLQELVGQKPTSSFTDAKQFKEFALNDHSGDNLSLSSYQGIIESAGFKCENFRVISKDDYITQLIRIVNPKVNRKKLKYPPVMLFHAVLGSTTDYLWASINQHHPENYPRLPSDGPITSSNRSMPFCLSNNGYDVWLVGTRGHQQSRGHVKFRGNEGKKDRNTIDNNGNKTLYEDDFELNDNSPEVVKYWDFSYDEIIKYEYPAQIDKVLEVTGAKMVSTIALATATIPAFALYATNEKYSKLTHNHISIAPTINARGSNRFVQFLHRIITWLPDEVGNVLFQSILASPELTRLILNLTKNRKDRYIYAKSLLNIFGGPSAKYRTSLEDSFLGNFLRLGGFKNIKHFSQIMLANRLQMFDYGFHNNLKVYGQIKPPKYDISNLKINEWLLISSEYDQIAPKSSVQQIIRQSNPKPSKHILIHNFNHLDLAAGFGNDLFVNLPIVEYLDRLSLNKTTNSNDKEDSNENSEKEDVEEDDIDSSRRSLSLINDDLDSNLIDDYVY